MAEQEAVPPIETPATPDVPPVAEPPQRPNAWRRLARFGFFPVVFAAALIASWLYQAHVVVEEDSAGAEPQKIAIKKITAVGSPVEHLARGDSALGRHLYAQALSHYEELLGAQAAAAPLVGYRVGLCNEALGHTELALAAYRKALTAASPSLTFACHVAMARCLLERNQPAEARRLLYPFIFDETRQADVPAAMVSDARYLIALALARAAHAPAQRLSADEPVSFATARLEIPFYLEEIGLGAPARPKIAEPATPEAASGKSSPLLINKSTSHESTRIMLVERTGLAVELIEGLASAGGLRVDWSAAARQALAERSLGLSLRNRPLVDVLEEAADSFDLACVVDGDACRIATRQETSKATLAQAERAATGRALRGARLVDKAHPWTPALYLELGNWEAAQGRDDEAAKWFERLAREFQGSPYVAPAYYNLARLHLRKPDTPRAMQALFRVIDHAPGHELAVRAHLRIGQLYLEQQNNKEAITQLRRAEALAPRSSYVPLATLALAAAYLQQDQPEAARAALGKQRATVQKPPYRHTAAFLDAYAQYRLAKGVTTGRREAGELLSTLWREQDEALLGQVGRCLVAQAYRDLGFMEQAEKLLLSLQTGGPMAACVDYLLAETLLKQHRRPDATHLFEKLAAAPSHYRGRASFQLAQLELQDKRFPECVHRCEELWTDQTFMDQPALLQTWGAALEGAGEFAKAAQCFGGKAPLK